MLSPAKTNDSDRQGFQASEHPLHETMALFDELDPRVRWALNYASVQWTVQDIWYKFPQLGVRSVRHVLVVIRHNDQLARDEAPGHDQGWPGVRP